MPGSVTKPQGNDIPEEMRELIGQSPALHGATPTLLLGLSSASRFIAGTIRLLIPSAEYR